MASAASCDRSSSSWRLLAALLVSDSCCCSLQSVAVYFDLYLAPTVAIVAAMVVAMPKQRAPPSAAVYSANRQAKSAARRVEELKRTQFDVSRARSRLPNIVGGCGIVGIGRELQSAALELATFGGAVDFRLLLAAIGGCLLRFVFSVDGRDCRDAEATGAAVDGCLFRKSPGK